MGPFVARPGRRSLQTTLFPGDGPKVDGDTSFALARYGGPVANGTAVPGTTRLLACILVPPLGEGIP